jgi:hypothetical protein
MSGLLLGMVRSVCICWFHSMGTRGGVVVEALRYKPEGRRFDSPMVLLEFFIDVILPVALWPWVRLSL